MSELDTKIYKSIEPKVFIVKPTKRLSRHQMDKKSIVEFSTSSDEDAKDHKYLPRTRNLKKSQKTSIGNIQSKAEKIDSLKTRKSSSIASISSKKSEFSESVPESSKQHKMSSKTVIQKEIPRTSSSANSSKCEKSASTDSSESDDTTETPTETPLENESGEVSEDESSEEIRVPKPAPRNEKSRSETRRQRSKSEKHLYKNILGVHIHGSDQLKFKSYIKAVRVRVSWYNVQTGELVRKHKKSRNVILNYEPDYMDYIQPIISREGRISSEKFAFNWDEILVINEDMDYMKNHNFIVFFELIDVVNPDSKNVTSYDGWHKICWAFLRPHTEKSDMFEKKCKLQLYKYKQKSQKAQYTSVLEEWSFKDRTKYFSTIDVSLIPLKPNVENIGLGRPHTALQMDKQEKLPTNIEKDLKIQRTTKEAKERVQLMESLTNNQESHWKSAFLTIKRSCFGFPNSISNSKNFKKGSTICEFSYDGNFVAYTEQSTVIIATIPNLQEIAHVYVNYDTGFVHSVKWLRSTEKNILIAAGDKFCKVASIGHQDFNLYEIIRHPSFVYAADFIEENGYWSFASGGKDQILRIWKVWADNKRPPKLCQEIKCHSSYIIGICTSVDNSRFFSADVNGNIFEFSKDIGHQIWIQKRKIGTIPGPLEYIQLHPRIERIYGITHSALYSMDFNSQYAKRLFSGIVSSKRGFHRFRLSRCGSYLFLPSNSNWITCCNLMTEAPVKKIEINLPRGSFVSALDCHPEGKYLAVSVYGKQQGGFQLYESNDSEDVKLTPTTGKSENVVETGRSIPGSLLDGNESFKEILEKLDNIFLSSSSQMSNRTDDFKLIEKQREETESSEAIPSNRTFTVTNDEKIGTYKIRKNEDFSNVTYTIEAVPNSEDTDISESLDD